MLTLEQAAAVCGLSRTAMRHHVVRGHCRAAKVGRAWVILEEDVRRFLEWRKQKRLRVNA